METSHLCTYRCFQAGTQSCRPRMDPNVTPLRWLIAALARQFPAIRPNAKFKREEWRKPSGTHMRHGLAHPACTSRCALTPFPKRECKSAHLKRHMHARAIHAAITLSAE